MKQPKREQKPIVIAWWHWLVAGPDVGVVWLAWDYLHGPMLTNFARLAGRALEC